MTETIWNLAFLEAKNAKLRGEVPIGAVIVDTNGTVLSSAGNRTRELRDASAHAEMLVLRDASTKMSAERLTNCDLYVTLEPCTMCAAAISFFRIRRLYFAAVDEKGGAVESGVQFFNKPTCHHAPEVYGHIRETEAAEILKEFFQERR